MRIEARALAALLLGASVLTGCGSSEEPAPPSGHAATGLSAGQPTTAREDAPEPAPVKPDPAEVWAKRLTESETALAAGDLEAAAKSLAALQEVYGDDGPPQAGQQSRLDQLQTELSEKQQAAAHKEREAMLASGRKLMDAGDFDESLRQIEAALARSPTDEQRQLAARLKREIEYRRKTRRTLGALRKLLGSEVSSEVQSAQLQLRKEPDTAMPLLIEWSQRAEEPRLVGNALETMRRIKRPALALPAMLGVLSRPEQQASWNAAAQAIAGTASEGIGPQLLELALESEIPEQQTAALAALAQVPDPPARTLVAVLPAILQDGPHLPAALRAAFGAVVVHGQYDLAARRGIEMELTPRQQQQLAELPARLADIIGRGADNPEAARLAKRLAIATRQLPAEPLSGVTVVGAGAESEDSRKEAVLDGVWNAVELETQWRYPIAEPGSIVLDLGEEKTVVGVRVWNFNQPGGTHRGWKETDVYVSNIKSELTSCSSGIIPPAPGAADPRDYSTVIPVQCVRGRYVKLKAKSVWRSDSYAGLAEIEVLGF